MRQARSPYRAVEWTVRNAIEAERDARVLAQVRRPARLVVAFVALAVAIGIDNEGGPTLGCRGVAGLPIFIDVDPADDRELSLRVGREPQRIVGILGKIQVLRTKARIDE